MKILKIIDEKIFLILAVTVLGGALTVVFVLLPMTQRIRGLNAQENLMAQDRNLVNGLIKSRDKNFPESRLISPNETSAVIEEITALGNTHSIMFLSLASQDKSKALYKKISTVPVDLETQSTYQELGLFMDGLNSIRKGIILVDSFQIARDTQELNKVKSKIRLHICLQKAAGNAKK